MSRLRRLLRPLAAISVVVLLCISTLHVYSPQRVEDWSASFNARTVDRIRVPDKVLENLPVILQRAHEYTKSELKLPTISSKKPSWGQKVKDNKRITVTSAARIPQYTTERSPSNTPMLGENSKDSPETNRAKVEQQLAKYHVNVQPKGWAYGGPNNLRCRVRTIGCFQPISKERKIAKSLQDLFDSSADMTDWSCIEFCSKRSKEKSIFVGVANGNECRCDQNVHNLVELEGSDKCTKPCSGDRSRKCGGWNRVTMLYQILNQCTETSPLPEVVDEKSILGCFPKPNLSSIMEEHVVEKDWAAARCLLHCERIGLVLAVPVHPNLCYCGLTTESFDLSNPVDFRKCTTAMNQYVMVYRTNIEDKRCGRRRFLEKGEWKNKVGLITFPGSGNTWLRHLIESVTGIYTGSYYEDKGLLNGGYMGELLKPSNYKIGVVKSHYQGHSNAEYFNSIIHVFRNPYDAVLSEYNRRKKGHTGTVAIGKFDQEAFNKLTNGSYMRKWRAITEVAISYTRRKLLFSYEDLVNNTLYYAEKMARFIMGDSVNEKDLRDRLCCLRLQSTGQFKRTKKPLTFDPFSLESKLHINEQIDILAEEYRKAGFGEFPDYRRST